MAKLHIYIDGSWLFSACKPGGVLSHSTATPDKVFNLDFERLSQVLLKHCAAKEPKVILGERIIATSVFSIPKEADKWVDTDPDMLPNEFEKTKRNIAARDIFIKHALSGGFSDQAVYRPILRPYIVKALSKGSWQEKMVDATIVALLVKNAITLHDDFHAVLTGDADILPALRVAYPRFTRNVFIATTHPDELKKEHRSSAFTISEFPFEVEPFYLQDHSKSLMAGSHILICANCKKPFESSKAIPKLQRPYCSSCGSLRH